MIYSIDTDMLTKQNIPKGIALLIFSLYGFNGISKDDIIKAQKLGYIKLDNNKEFDIPKMKLTSEGFSLGITFVTEQISKKIDEKRFIELADKLRELYPKGKKDGTVQMWRDSTQVIAKKLINVVKKYNIEFTDEEAINATKRYIESFNGDYRFMHVLKYFLLKKDLNTGEENSQFLSYLQNDDEINSSSDWTIELR